MTSENTDLPKSFEYEDDISISDSYDDSRAINCYPCQFEDKSHHSFKGSGDDGDFLAIWGQSSSGNMGVTTSSSSSGLNFVSSESDDEDLSESDVDFDKEDRYSSDEMLSEDSESSSCPSESDILDLEDNDCHMMCDRNEYHENNESSLLMGLEDELDSVHGRQESQPSYADFMTRNRIYIQEPKKQEMIVHEQECAKIEQNPSKVEVETYLRSEHDVPKKNRRKIQVEEPSQITRSFLLNRQQMGNFLKEDHTPFMMNIEQDERSTMSDKTQKVRNTSTYLELSLSNEIVCAASNEEEWVANCTAPMFVVPSAGDPPSLAECKLVCDSNASLLHRYKQTCNIMLSRRGHLFYWHLCMMIGLMATATIVYVSTFMGLETRSKNNASLLKEYENQEISPPSPSPTISILRAGSVWQDDIIY